MVDIIKQDMTDIWAVAGDVVAPDPAKVRAGWAVEAVPRQWWNFIENRQDANIAYMLQKGIPEWDAFTEYLNNKSYVQRNGIIYRSIQTGTNQDPATATTYWTRAFAESSASLQALKAVTPAADRLPYFTGASTAAITTLTSFARTLLDDVDATTMRATLAVQEADANLTALSGVTPNTNVLPYFNSTTTMTGTTLTAFGRNLIDDADAAAGRSTLGLGTVSTFDVTTTPSDATANRIVKVGDFGENGGNSIVMGPADNADNLTPGMYSFPSGGVNLPIAAAFYVKHIGYPVVGYGRQIAWNITLNSSYIRFQASGVWSAWTEDWTTDNLVKTTSATDSTAGRMLKVGDFGLGGLAPSISEALINSSDYPTGFYFVIAAAQGFLPVNVNGYLQHTDIASVGYALQRFTVVSSTATYFRQQTGGVWGGWTQVANVTDITSALTAYALKGANSDITSLSGLTTALSVAQGGTGTTTSTGTGSTVRSASPTFTGTPLSTTAAPGTNTTQIATTAFVTALGALKADTASPALTGTPTAPTAGAGTSTTQIATTAFVTAADNLKADLASPALTGTPTSPTAAPGNNTTQIATTAFVAALGALKANTASPSLTGTPLAPTAAVGTNTTQIATTAFVLANSYSQADIVGVVSQSGGIPTGAIIERGANASGDYVKFADGTMICTSGGLGQSTASIPINSHTNSTVFNTAAAFVNATWSVMVSVGPSISNDHYGVTNSSSTANNQFTLIIRNGATTAQNFAVRFIAIGRWF